MKKIMLLSALLSSGAFAETAKDKMEHLLGLIDVPVGKAQLEEATGSQTAALLREMALDKKAPRLFRQRAVAFLAFYPSPETLRTLLVACQDAHGPVRKEAINLLSHSLDKREVLAQVTLALDDASVVVRKAAIRALQGRSEALPALARRKTLEKDAHARRLLDAALTSAQ